MATVFDVFKKVDYEYLEISRGGVYGNTITKATAFRGIFKVRNGKTESPVNDMEVRDSNATLHVHPEDFDDINGLVGNGIRYNGQTYEIVNVTGGMNFDTGAMEHLTLTLEVADYVDNSQGN